MIKSNYSPSSNGSYRPDIDGLRAVAVIAVILYHFHIPFFQGGFVGVDIFFVISGYLITKNIVSQVDAGRFRFSEFYSRRTRRLIPTLLSVILASFVCAALLMSPADMASFSGSVVYAVAGISNFYFWMQSGYFDSFSSLKPLLHTWSLSVELQFYLIWPVLMILLCRFESLRKLRYLFVLLFILISGYLSANLSYSNSETAFFMTPFRMHEFAIGGLISFLNTQRYNRALLSLLYVSGLSIVIGSIFMLNVTDFVFPGYVAMIPCLGAALMIASGGSHPFSLLTGNRFASHIGEISYSLYLVHWPVFVFGSYAIVFEPTVKQTVMMIAFTIIASYLVYYTIEKPFRNPNTSKLTNPWFNAACATAALLIAVPATSSWKGGGWEWRIPEEIRTASNISSSLSTDYTWAYQREIAKHKSFSQDSTRPKLLVIGDSQSADVINALMESGGLKDFNVVAKTVSMECGVPYISKEESADFFSKVNKATIAKPELIAGCVSQMNEAFDEKLLGQADKIVIAMYYPAESLKYLLSAIDKLNSETTAKVYLIGRKNLSRSSLDIVNSFQRIVGVERYASKFKDGTAEAINYALKLKADANFIDPLKFVCVSDDNCKVVDEQKRPLFFDKAHFTKYGAEYFGKQLLSSIQ
ncbi:acyltransferase family protein [Escherichia coli]